MEQEGNAHLPPGAAILGEEIGLENVVGVPEPLLPSPNSSRGREEAARASFASMWLFRAQGSRSKNSAFDFESNGREGGNHFNDGNHFRGANADANGQDQSGSGSDSDDSDEGGYGDRGAGRRRLSVTTEAKRRTSLDDDEEDEVVHVGREGEEEVRESGVDSEEELVEIQHAQ